MSITLPKITRLLIIACMDVGTWTLQEQKVRAYMDVGTQKMSGTNFLPWHHSIAYMDVST